MPTVTRGPRWQRTAYTVGTVAPGTATSVVNSVASGTTVVNRPTISDGTLLIASIATDSATVSAAPSGWALVPTTLFASGTGWAYSIYYLYVAAASGEPSSYTWTLSGSSKNSGIIVPFTGVNVASPFEINAVSNNIGTAYTNINPNRAGGLLIGGAVASTDGGTTLTQPSGWTEITEVAGAQNAVGYLPGAFDYAQQAGVTASWTRGDAATGANAGGIWATVLRSANAYTWTKPAWAKRVTVFSVMGGGGGGGGRRGATNTNRGGGGGGAGGIRNQFTIDGALCPSTLSVVVGHGGAGGAYASTDTANGSASGSGTVCSVTGTGISELANSNQASSPGGGLGGTVAAGTAGTVINQNAWGPRDVPTNGTAGALSADATASSASGGAPTGGGGGGGIQATGNTAFNPGGSGPTGIATVTTLTNAGTSGTDGTPGTADVSGQLGGQGGTGGQANASGAAGHGGDGGFPGGGGGGGGAVLNGNRSGHGGKGGHGVVVIEVEG